MARKPRPRYPNRDRLIFKRFISQILLLLFGIALAVFYLVFNTSSHDVMEEAPQIPTVNGTQAGIPSQAPSGLNSRQPSPPPQGDKTPQVPAAQVQDAPGPAAPQPRTPPVAQAPPPVQPAAPGASGQKRAVPAAPFAGKTLGDVAATLEKQLSGTRSTGWGERLPGVTTALGLAPRQDGRPVVALTLDACGGKKGASHDDGLIAFLREQRIPATLFVTTLWMRTNPDVLADLAADPLFEIAAHGSRHRPCSIDGKSVYGIKGTANFGELVQEVEGNARDIEQATSTRPRWFRSGTAYYDNVAVAAIRELGLRIAGYSIAGDEGATLSAARVAAKVRAARHGDIILCHMNKPRSGTREGLRSALSDLLERNYVFVRLSELPEQTP